MKAIRIHEFGGLDVLNWEEAPDPEPRPHQVLIKVDSAGVNYADLMRRGGNYPGPDLPASLGLEAAGTVVEVGSDVSGVSVGQRVMAMGPGGQAELVAVNANFVFPYPETVDPVQAGGMPIVFLTAYHLLKTRGQVEPGHTVLIQAGASGVGTVAIQLAKAWGARVVVTASTQEKLDLCRSLGADETINYIQQDFEEVIKEQTGGNGVELILECVGGPVLEKSLRCVAPYGRMLTYGNASGTPASLAGGRNLRGQPHGYRLQHRALSGGYPGPPGCYGGDISSDGGWQGKAGRRPGAANVRCGQCSRTLGQPGHQRESDTNAVTGPTAAGRMLIKDWRNKFCPQARRDLGLADSGNCECPGGRPI